MWWDTACLHRRGVGSEVARMMGYRCRVQKKFHKCRVEIRTKHNSTAIVNMINLEAVRQVAV